MEEILKSEFRSVMAVTKIYCILSLCITVFETIVLQGLQVAMTTIYAHV